LLDGILLEQAGIPTAVVLTQPFILSGKMIATNHGCPDYPFAVMPHPIATQPDSVIKEWAEALAPRVVEILLRS
jgi:hypothetical protein